MKMKCSKNFIVTVIALLVAAKYAWYRVQDTYDVRYTGTPDAQGGVEHDVIMWRLRTGKYPTNSPAPAPQPSSNRNPHSLLFRKKANELNDAEKVAMTNLFVIKLKPAAEKWASVYGDHVPFSLADLTMDKFVERIGHDTGAYHSYTFVMGDITLGIAQQSGYAQVQYLASKHGLQTMQTMPPTGAAPDVSMPVTPQQALALAEADSGVQFPPNEVRLIPSAESSSLAGGAIVDVGNQVKNAMGIPISKTSAGFNYVFAKDGTLAYYLRAH